MRTHKFFRCAFAFLLVLWVVGSARALDGCVTASNAANLAKERMERAGNEENNPFLERALSYLEIGTGACPNENVVAEAWYLRAMVERRLGKPSIDSDFSLEQARRMGYRPDKHSVPDVLPHPADVPVQAALPPVVREKWALVVGIGDFLHVRIRPLPFAAKDAEDFAAVLTDEKIGRFKQQNVTTLLNTEATLFNIRRAIGEIRAKAKPDDLVVVYIASHGSPRALDPSGVSYVVAHDTDLRTPGDFYASSLQMIDLVNTLSRDLQAARLALILDTCYSGEAVRFASRDLMLTPIEMEAGESAPSSQSFSPALQGMRLRPGHLVLTASRANERSYESEDLQNGIFTHFLLSLLRQTGGTQPLEKLFPELRRRVGEVARETVGFPQTPTIELGQHAGTLTLGVASAPALEPEIAASHLGAGPSVPHSASSTVRHLAALYARGTVSPRTSKLRKEE